MNKALDSYNSDIRIFDVLSFFKSIEDFNKFRDDFLEYIYKRFDPVDDMPGCLRYHLDNKETLEFLNVYLSCEKIVRSVKEMLSAQRYFVTFVRYRNPLKDGGLQDFHQDFYHSKKTRRLEIFIILDDFSKENGCLEIYFDGNIIPIVLRKGSVIIMDSAVFHRGTTNASGASRILIDVHVGSDLLDKEKIIAYYPE